MAVVVDESTWKSSDLLSDLQGIAMKLNSCGLEKSQYDIVASLLVENAISLEAACVDSNFDDLALFVLALLPLFAFVGSDIFSALADDDSLPALASGLSTFADLVELDFSALTVVAFSACSLVLNTAQD